LEIFTGGGYSWLPGPSGGQAGIRGAGEVTAANSESPGGTALRGSWSSFPTCEWKDILGFQGREQAAQKCSSYRSNPESANCPVPGCELAQLAWGLTGAERRVSMPCKASQIAPAGSSPRRVWQDSAGQCGKIQPQCLEAGAACGIARDTRKRGAHDTLAGSRCCVACRHSGIRSGLRRARRELRRASPGA
jgi:hypothetical protein